MSIKILIYLLELYLVMFVNGRHLGGENDKSENDFPASVEQKRYIAESVCTDLEFYLKTEEAVTRCKENFSWDLELEKSNLQIRCRSNLTVTFEVSNTPLYQLILLIPEPNNNDPYAVIYSIIQSDKKYETVIISPGINYTTFSAVLNKHGRPYKWHQETKITKLGATHKEYDMQVEFSNIDNDSTDVLFTWSQIGELDSCFDLITKCEESDTKGMQIWPTSPLSAMIKELPLNDLCYVKLTGLYGTTTYTYHTPASKTPRQEDPVPAYPQDVALEAEEAGAGWTVHVTWSKPEIVPDSYNVTLRADDVITIVVSGNATEAIFKDITGEGIYSMSLYAIMGHRAAHTSRRALFPTRRHTGWPWAGAAGGAWAAVGFGVVAAALCWLRFRKRNVRHSKLQGIETKSIEENDQDTVGVEGWSTDVWEVKSERLQLHEVIGEGAFGVVRRGTLAPHGKEVAVKMLKDLPSLEETRSFRLEMELMKSVGAHPHVVSLVGCCSGTQPLIIAEYCSRGDLLSFLRRSWDVMVSKRNAKYYNNNIDSTNYRNDLFKFKDPQELSRLVVNNMYDLQAASEPDLTSLDLLSFCRQIAMGMEFLASNRLVHRDLAARNILVTHDRTLKIADFGLSRDVYEENQYKQKGNGKMPVKWMALESLTRRIYTTQSDVWSFGVVVWEVVTVGGSPYPGVPAARLSRLLRAGYRMPRPHNCTDQLYEVMLSCWRASPRERPTFAELHARLDELLLGACAGDYLSLELDDEPPPSPKHHRYFRMLIRAKRNWMRGENYERPLKAPHNLYTSSPVTMNKTTA